MVHEEHITLGDLFLSSREKGYAGLPLLSVTLNNGVVNRETLDRRTETNIEPDSHLLVKKGYIAYNMMRVWQGALGRVNHDGLVSPAYVILKPTTLIDTVYAEYLFKSPRLIYLFWAYSYGITKDRLRLYFNDFAKIPINIPPISEQRKIAQILSTWDKAIIITESLIANSQQQKKSLMQQLITGKKRFAEFKEEWKDSRIKDCAICMDNKRVPLNKEQRFNRKGEIPYWGANGILDYVNDYIFDETIVLIAEDGGYFKEFSSRPIANISHGKSWVNNHAHILKAKSNVSNKWLYYSIVHKNILAFINGGTRAKLNKSDMLLIPILLPAPIPRLDPDKIHFKFLYLDSICSLNL